MTTVGYARVSTDHQNLSAQSDALDAAGCERVFTDQLSGVRADCPGLAAMLDYVRPVDTVVVVTCSSRWRSSHSAMWPAGGRGDHARLPKDG